MRDQGYCSNGDALAEIAAHQVILKVDTYRLLRSFFHGFVSLSMAKFYKQIIKGYCVIISSQKPDLKESLFLT